MIERRVFSRTIMQATKIRYFVGVDIQVRRGIAYAVFDRHARLINSGWVLGSDDSINDLVEIFE